MAGDLCRRTTRRPGGGAGRRRAVLVVTAAALAAAIGCSGFELDFPRPTSGDGPTGSPSTDPGGGKTTPPGDSVDCGRVTGWDGDGDSVSDSVERNRANAAHAFDPADCDRDPTRPVGDYYAGSLSRGVNLTDGGAGYVHHRGSDAVDTDDWAALKLIACLEAVGRGWEASGRRLNVNDLSLRDGGDFPPHRSHQNGLDADLRYVRRDGLDHPLDIRRNPEEYDPAATQALLQLFLDRCDVAVIFVDSAHLGFSDTDLVGGAGLIQHAPGHSNHFHLRLEPPS